MNSFFYFVIGIMIIIFLSVIIFSMFFTLFWNIALFGVFGLPYLSWLEGFALVSLISMISGLLFSKVKVNA